jgi:hypothetical protein
MRNVLMIRPEAGLVAIPVEKAVYCENCQTVSTSTRQRCGLCGSEQIARLVPLIPEPWDPSSSRDLGRIRPSMIRGDLFGLLGKGSNP